MRQRIDMSDSQSAHMVDRIVGATSEIPGYALRRDEDNEAQSIISTNKLMSEDPSGLHAEDGSVSGQQNSTDMYKGHDEAHS
mgnify:CR=1 FL=1